MAFDPHKITSLNAEVVGHAPAPGGSGSGESQGGGGESGTGRIFYVNNDISNLPDGGEVGADITRFGDSILQPFATIDYAIGKCAAGRGDKIIVMPGHAETLTAGITLDVQGVTVEGRGRGTDRPQISSATASIDLFTITAANCKIENILFNEVTDAVDSLINIAADDCVVEGCQFDVGASNTNPCITHASGARFVLRDNQIRVTADGPNEFYSAEAAVDGCLIENNIFDGGSAANVFDDAHIDLGSLVVTNMIIRDNLFIYGIGLTGSGNALVHYFDNKFMGVCIPKAGIPLTIYVDPSGSTTGEGTREDPTTLAAAVTASTAGSRILLYPGTYTLTAAQALNTANMTVEPVDYIPGSRLVNITSATDGSKLFVVTAAGCVLRGIRFTHTGTESSANPMVQASSGGDQFLITDCTFDHAAVANVEGVEIDAGVNDAKVLGCEFILPASGEISIQNAGAQTEIANCRFDFSGGVGTAVAELATPGAGTHIHHNSFSGDGTDHIFLTWTGDPSVGAAVHTNIVTESGTTATLIFGNDTDLDTVIVDNHMAGGSAGARIVIDPSV